MEVEKPTLTMQYQVKEIMEEIVTLLEVIVTEDLALAAAELALVVLMHLVLELVVMVVMGFLILGFLVHMEQLGHHLEDGLQVEAVDLPEVTLVIIGLILLELMVVPVVEAEEQAKVILQWPEPPIQVEVAEIPEMVDQDLLLLE